MLIAFVLVLVIKTGKVLWVRVAMCYKSLHVQNS